MKKEHCRDPAGRRLDELLASIPDLLISLYENTAFKPTLESLYSAKSPSSEWVRTRAQNIRVKCRTVIAAQERAKQDLSGAARDYSACDNPDATKLAVAALYEAQLTEKTEALKNIVTAMASVIQSVDTAAALDSQAAVLDAITQLKIRHKEEPE